MIRSDRLQAVLLPRHLADRGRTYATFSSRFGSYTSFVRHTASTIEAMVSLGITNTRVKDLFDVHRLSAKFSFDGASLSHARRATFEGRGTPVPDAEPLILTREFLTASERQTQWRAFLRRSRLEAPTTPAPWSMTCGPSSSR